LTFCRGTEIWRIENFQPVPLPKSEHGKFYMGDSYIILQVCTISDITLEHWYVCKCMWCCSLVIRLDILEIVDLF